MNDAYTVGLTLALDDGVSAGIATIRRELRTLDTAIVVSTANLVRLQEVARVAVSAGVAQAGAMAARTRDSAAAAMRQTAANAQTPDEANTAVPTVGPAAWPEKPGATFVPTPPAAMPAVGAIAGAASAPMTRALPELAQPTSPAATTEPARRAAPPAAEAKTQSAAPPAVAPPAAVAQLAPIAPVQMPPVVAPPTQFRTVPSVPAAPQVGPVRLAEAAVPPPAQPVATPAVSMAMARPAAAVSRAADRASAPTVYLESRLAPVFPPPSQPETPAAASLAPVTHSAQMAPTRQIQDRPVARERASSAAPRQQSQRQRDKAMGGTIVIDGAEMGRWMADYLAHAASRPPSGGAAFDPRMAPVWAGAPIGA